MFEIRNVVILEEVKVKPQNLQERRWGSCNTILVEIIPFAWLCCSPDGTMSCTD